MSKAPSYTPLTLRRLPHLATLDGHTLTGEDWESAAASHGLLTIPLLEECSSTRLLSNWSNAGEYSIAKQREPGGCAAHSLRVLALKEQDACSLPCVHSYGITLQQWSIDSVPKD